MKRTLTVHGMHCKSCVALITEALEEAGATDIVVDLDAKAQVGTVTLTTSQSPRALKKIISEQGDYTVSE